MKIVIAGAGGQVGRVLLSSVPDGVRAVGLTRAELDIGDRSAASAIIRSHRPDLIICAGAHTAVDRAESEPDRAALVNTEGPRNLALAAAEVGARLLHISTDFVFDGRASTAYRPDSETHPLSVYGRTKLAGEQEIQKLLPDNAVIVRTSWVYSAEGNNFLRTMLRVMSTKGHVRVVADQIGTPTAATSLAHALWAIAARPDLKGVYHWTDAGVASWYDFAVAIAEEATALSLLAGDVRVDPIVTDEYPTAARRPAFSVLDSRTLREALALTPRHWRSHLRDVLKGMKHA